MPTKEQMRQALMESVRSMDELTPSLKALIYGESGVGKTVAALEIAQALSKKRILYVDAVEGWVSLRNHPKLRENVTRIQYEGLSQLQLIHDLFQAGDEWATQFDFVIFDEISVIAQLDLDRVLEGSVKRDPTKDPDVPVWPDMNAATQRVRRITIAFSRLDLHQIYLSHIREDEDKSKGYKVTRPEFMPKLSTTIRNGLHLVAYMSASEKTVDGNKQYIRSLQVHPSKTVVAKSRIGGLSIHTTVSSLIRQLVEWVGGGVEEVEVADVVDDTTPAILSDDNDPAIEVK